MDFHQLSAFDEFHELFVVNDIVSVPVNVGQDRLLDVGWYSCRP